MKYEGVKAVHTSDSQILRVLTRIPWSCGPKINDTMKIASTG